MGHIKLYTLNSHSDYKLENIMQTKKKSFVLRGEALNKWLKNAAMFTLPCLVVFFTQLSLGVEPREAVGVAMLALYGLIADYLKKLKA